jgi:hypothetical protein
MSLALSPHPSANGRPTLAEPLPLSRNALSAWVRWAEAGDDERSRKFVAQQSKLSPRECAALDRLRENLLAAGPQSGWSHPSTSATVGYRLRAGLLDEILAGLAIGVTDRARFRRVLDPQTKGVEWALDAALAERFGRTGGFEETMLARCPPVLPVPRVPELPPPVLLGSASPVPEPRPRPPRTEDRVMEALAALGLFLDQPLYDEDKCAIADRCGIEPGTVNNYLKKIRARHRVRIHTPAPRAPIEAPARDGEELAARALVLGQARTLARLVLEQGSDHLDFADLEAPLRELVRVVLNWDAAVGPRPAAGGEPCE